MSAQGEAGLRDLIEFHKIGCARYANGQCSTRRCMVRGGWTPGNRTDFSQATCEEHETVIALERLSLSAPSPAATVAEGVAECWQYRIFRHGEWGAWTDIDDDGACKLQEAGHLDGYQAQTRPLYAHPAPSGPADARVRELVKAAFMEGLGRGQTQGESMAEGFAVRSPEKTWEDSKAYASLRSGGAAR